MKRLNNKGQALVMFVLVVPIILLVLVLVYDVGNALYEKDKLNNINLMAIDYGLEHIDTVTESDLIELIMKNTDNMSKISVVIEDNVITIEIEKNSKGIIGDFFDITKIVSKYQGEMVDDKKRIERVK